MMVARQHLNNAPIKEAIIDFRVGLPPDVTIEQLEKITKILPKEYSEIDLRNQISTEIIIGKDSKPDVSSSDSVPVGFWCTTDDARNIAQIRMDGFTFSELKSYTSWKEFSLKAQHIWELYREGTGCDAISRVALRYINHLELPLKHGDDYSKYLVSPPDVPESLPQSISNFMNRVTIVASEKGIFAHVTQALALLENQGQHNILLDIDVFKQTGEVIPVGDVWDIFEKLRHFKNDIFFGYITEKTMEIVK